MNNQDKVFKALADEHRRKLLKVISASKREYNLSELSELFPMTRQGLSKHLSKLTGANLLEVRFDGREKFFSANLDPLNLVAFWLQQFDAETTFPTKEAGEKIGEEATIKSNSFIDFIESQGR